MVATTPRPAVTGRHLIAGAWRPPLGARFESLNPHRLDEVVGAFPKANAAEAQEAVTVARDAFSSWRRTSRMLRAELFDNLAQIITGQADAIAELMARECGKVVSECRAEVIEGLHMVQY